ncbi:hypothetical protein L226DRAFT_532995 [Lentinus tigrinus ALCF2SS1-7]|uniref:uncharacterized protein n=1 Tax=Lentinus tigrinus ALCF2SS1-7 TaxID=1328758 RepID=UPI001165D6D2|nr:hypothetical protein L226DRAFT_532995 [Lentinus tigrinus ALCF2SS1-7]
MMEELQDHAEDIFVREIHGVCALGTRVWIYRMDTHSQTMAAGPGTRETADALRDLDVASEEGSRTLVEYVRQALQRRSRPSTM